MNGAVCTYCPPSRLLPPPSPLRLSLRRFLSPPRHPENTPVTPMASQLHLWVSTLPSPPKENKKKKRVENRRKKASASDFRAIVLDIYMSKNKTGVCASWRGIESDELIFCPSTSNDKKLKKVLRLSQVRPRHFKLLFNNDLSLSLLYLEAQSCRRSTFNC